MSSGRAREATHFPQPAGTRCSVMSTLRRKRRRRKSRPLVIFVEMHFFRSFVLLRCFTRLPRRVRDKRPTELARSSPGAVRNRLTRLRWISQPCSVRFGTPRTHRVKWNGTQKKRRRLPDRSCEPEQMERFDYCARRSRGGGSRRIVSRRGNRQPRETEITGVDTLRARMIMRTPAVPSARNRVLAATLVETREVLGTLGHCAAYSLATA